MRGRNNNRNKGPNPLTRSYESNGPDVKIRGTAQHIADKYAQLARDAQASGDPVAAENYLQHAEHYYRIIAAAQEQFREQFGGFQRSADEDGDEEAGGFGYGHPGERVQGAPGGEDADFGSQPQPYDGRPEGDRPNRFENRDRQDRSERFDRGDRPERPDQRVPRGERQNEPRFDRGDRQDRNEPRLDRNDRQDRGDRRDRFPRNDRPPRQDFQRPEGGPRDGAPRENGPSDYRQEQPRFPRRPRREEVEEDAGANGLPAFLTNPVRTPIAIGGEQAEDPAEAAAPLESLNGEAPNGDGRYRQRRRRRPRFEEGGEATPDAGSEIAPEGLEPPPAK
jgi:hypothetical protein